MSNFRFMHGVLGIRETEEVQAVLFFCHSFLIGVTLMTFDTAARGIFFSRFGAEKLAWVYIISAIVVAAVGVIFSKLESRCSLPDLLGGCLVLVAITCCLSRIALEVSNSSYVIMSLLIAYEVMEVLTALAFWLLAGRIFDLRQGKRLFALISSGAVLANIVTGLSIPLLVSFFGGASNVLWFSAVAAGANIVVFKKIVSRYRHIVSPLSEAGVEKTIIHQPGIKDILGRPYTRMICAFVFLSYMTYCLVDFVLYDQIEHRYVDQDSIASFLGLFLALVNVILFIVQTFISGRLLTSFGVSFGLVLLPVTLLGIVVSLLLGSSMVGGVMVFILALGGKMAYRVLWASFEKPSTVVLYQPLRGGWRTGVQTHAESFVEPASAIASGLLLLVISRCFEWGTEGISVLLVVVLIGYFVYGLWLNTGYKDEVAKILSRRRFVGESLSLGDAETLNVLKKSLESVHTGEVVYALHLLERVGDKSCIPILVNLLEHQDAEVRIAVIDRLGKSNSSEASQALRTTLVSDNDSGVRGKALGALCCHSEYIDMGEIKGYCSNEYHRDIRIAAFTALLNNCGPEGKEVGHKMIPLLIHSHDVEERILAAQVLKNVAMTPQDDPLTLLLDDGNSRVCHEAIRAVGALGRIDQAPRLVNYLGNSAHRFTAAKALEKMGGEVLVELRRQYEQTVSPLIRRRIIRITGRIGNPAAISFLWERLNDTDDILRHSTLEALVQCGYRAEEQDKTRRVSVCIKQEVASAVWNLGARIDISEQAPDSILYESLVSRQRLILDRILLLLSFIYPAQRVLHARENLSGVKLDRRVYAIEAFDSFLEEKDKRIILPLVEAGNEQEQYKALQKYGSDSLLGFSGRILNILVSEHANPWLVSCAIFVGVKSKIHIPNSRLEEKRGHAEEMVRETVLWAQSQ
ncbi:MAG: HEAT repeat domain-containing protein [Planctomycetes bacterium]|nr:HEAT repeat domain-containing protein [Planctomycetota bacterium]